MHFCCISWEAGQVLARKLMLGLVSDFQENKRLILNPQFVHGIKSILGDLSLDKVCINLSRFILFHNNKVCYLVFLDFLI